MRRRTRTPALAQLVADSWAAGEDGVREKIRAQYRDSDEEFITGLLRGELEEVCDRVSRNGSVGRAFLADPKATVARIRADLLSPMANRLVATVSCDPRHVERQTGSDPGIVLATPHVQQQYGEYLAIESNCKRGLLCQAIVFGHDSRWGRLKQNQKKMLSGKTSYSALLLYRYSDQDGSRRELNPFARQLTRESTIEDIQKWLRADSFPKVWRSSAIFNSVMDAQIGTDDRRLVDEYVAPEGLRNSLVITIKWKDGADPGDRVLVSSRPSQQREHMLLARW
jgi:hypothetical protein